MVKPAKNTICLWYDPLREFRQGFTEEVERELVEVSKFVPEAIETYGSMIGEHLHPRIWVGATGTSQPLAIPVMAKRALLARRTT